MSEESCGCDRFERLEGAAAQAYIVRFLERADECDETGASYYRCRICSRDWKRIEEAGQRRPSLVRLPLSENV